MMVKISDRDAHSETRLNMVRVFKLLSSKQVHLDDLSKRKKREIRAFKAAQNKEITANATRSNRQARNDATTIYRAFTVTGEIFSSHNQWITRN